MLLTEECGENLVEISVKSLNIGAIIILLLALLEDGFFFNLKLMIRVSL